MPTVMRIDGLIVVVRSNDHRPSHVHVMGHGCEAVFKLHCPHGPPELRENYGFKDPELGKILEALDANLAYLCKEWRRIHGLF